jgi:hypothetical protein
MRAAGNDVQLIEYPDAPHSYDNPLGPTPARLSKGSESTRDCTLKEEQLGIIINTATGKPFAYKDDCIRRDPHVGYHEDAANATRKAVKAFGADRVQVVNLNLRPTQQRPPSRAAFTFHRLPIHKRRIRIKSPAPVCRP